MKQAIILRADLGMGKGKLVAQGSHASVSSLLDALEKAETDAKTWVEEGQKKIVLKAASEKDVVAIFKDAKKAKIPCAIIKDAGLTQIPAGSITAVAIGPAEDGRIDAITRLLKLL